MRKILWGFPALFLVAWLVWPYLTLYQLNQAVTAQDEQALDNLVDWDSVGTYLADDLEAMFAGQGSNTSDGEEDPLGGLLDILINSFADLLIDPVVAFYTTPQGLSYLLNTQIILEDPMEVFEDDFPAEGSWYDHISLAFFSSPTTFFAKVEFPEENAKGNQSGEAMTLVLRFQGFRWQLSRIELPLNEPIE